MIDSNNKNIEPLAQGETLSPDNMETNWIDVEKEEYEKMFVKLFVPVEDNLKERKFNE